MGFKFSFKFIGSINEILFLIEEKRYIYYFLKMEFFLVLVFNRNFLNESLFRFGE